MNPVLASSIAARAREEENVPDVATPVGEQLSISAFNQLPRRLGGYSFVKVVVDRTNSTIHFLNNAEHAFHAVYIGEQILGISKDEMGRTIDRYNQTFQHDPDRRFYLGILALHTREGRRIPSLETVEVDTMSSDMIVWFHHFVRDHVDQSLPLLFKPANHLQEQAVAQLPPAELSRILAHELFSSAQFIASNPVETRGRLRAFRSLAEYRSTRWNGTTSS